MIGVVGLGAMGRGIATTLLREFKDVIVFEIDKERMARIVAAGATAATSAGDLAAKCETILTSLPNSKVAIEVIEHDVLPHVSTGTIVVDMGTTIVSETRRVASLYTARGASLVDAPVSGGPVGTATGQLYTFVGGDRDAVQRVWPVLKLLSKARLTYCGPSGAGQVTKGVNQLAMGLLNAAMVEAVAYGAASGVDEAILLEAIGGQGGFRGEFAKVASHIAAGLGDQVNYKHTEFDYFLAQSDDVGFAAPIMRALAAYMEPFPYDQIDNMNRAFPSLWGALMGAKSPQAEEREKLQSEERKSPKGEESQGPQAEERRE